MHDVIGLLQNGETIDTVRTDCFPQLTRSQVYECLAYYEDHRGEIDLLVVRDGRGAVKFLLDQDVPDDLSYLLKELGHESVGAAGLRDSVSPDGTETQRSRLEHQIDDVLCVRVGLVAEPLYPIIRVGKR